MVRFAGAAALAVGMMTAAPALAGELAIGGFTHDSDFGVSGSPHENGTYDVQVLVRTHQLESLWFLLKPMVYAKAQLNTDARTNFYTLGVEWRKHLFHTPFYGDFGIGGAYVDGFNTYPDHFQLGTGAPPAGSTAAQADQYYRDLHVYEKHKAMGSDFVFNPNFTLGYDFTRHLAGEISWEHYSNAGLGGRNPGMDDYGARIVWRFGGPF
jgi:hypothetical protein